VSQRNSANQGHVLREYGSSKSSQRKSGKKGGKRRWVAPVPGKNRKSVSAEINTWILGGKNPVRNATILRRESQAMEAGGNDQTLSFSKKTEDEFGRPKG